MRKAVLGALAGAGLVVAAIGSLDCGSEVFAQRPVPDHPAAWGSELIALSGPPGKEGQLITVIDPKLRVMSVYHVEQTTGRIALRSVRNIHWDLQMMEFNSESPLPREIQSLLEQR